MSDEIAKRQGHPDRAEIEREILRSHSGQELEVIDNDPTRYARAFDAAAARVSERKKQERHDAMIAHDGRALKSKLRAHEAAPAPRPQEPTEDPGTVRARTLMGRVRIAPDEDSAIEAAAAYLQFLEQTRGGEEE